MHCVFQANMEFKLATFTSLNAIFGLFMFPQKKSIFPSEPPAIETLLFIKCIFIITFV